MSEPFGPFRKGMDWRERTAQLRCLRTLVHIHLGVIEEGQQLERSLRLAEWRDECPRRALEMFDRLPTLARRRILATFAFIHRPLYSSARKQPKKGTAHAYVE